MPPALATVLRVIVAAIVFLLAAVWVDVGVKVASLDARGNAVSPFSEHRFYAALGMALMVAILGVGVLLGKRHSRTVFIVFISVGGATIAGLTIWSLLRHSSGA